jgi:hypothetical protein
MEEKMYFSIYIGGTKMKISVEDVKYIAQLAKLNFT